MAVHLGLARHVVVFRALNGRSGARVGTNRAPGPATDFRYPVGLTAYVHYISLWARRFLIETGQTEDDLAAVAVAQRAYAEQNERAYLRAPHSVEAHFAAPYVAEPFRVPDCTIEVDGACARGGHRRSTRRVTSRSLRSCCRAPRYAAGRGAGLDMGDSLFWEDLSRNYTVAARRRPLGLGRARAVRRRPRRDLRLLHEHRADGPRGARARRARRRRRLRAPGPLAGEHPRRPARRGLPARDEHGGRGRAAAAGPRAAPARSPAPRPAWSRRARSWTAPRSCWRSTGDPSRRRRRRRRVLVGARRRHAARRGVRRVRPPLAPTARHVPTLRVARRDAARRQRRRARSTPGP